MPSPHSFTSCSTTGLPLSHRHPNRCLRSTPLHGNNSLVTVLTSTSLTSTAQTNHLPPRTLQLPASLLFAQPTTTAYLLPRSPYLHLRLMVPPRTQLSCLPPLPLRLSLRRSLPFPRRFVRGRLPLLFLSRFPRSAQCHHLLRRPLRSRGSNPARKHLHRNNLRPRCLQVRRMPTNLPLQSYDALLALATPLTAMATMVVKALAISHTSQRAKPTTLFALPRLAASSNRVSMQPQLQWRPKPKTMTPTSLPTTKQ